MNELNHETSPYLLQHANNPVHWKAWSDNSLALAQKESKLIIISVGYSACHWCHVMEHDSFEDQEAADVMNKDFISIKVDREERPDIDAIYMKAVQLMGGHGGWPLNIVALPDGRPIWGGTYFPKNNWIDYLSQLAEMYRHDPDKLLEYAERLHEGIRTISVVETKIPEHKPTSDILKPLVHKWKKSFDREFGGMARAPKFMMPNNYKFLTRYAWENNDTELMDFVNLTLTKMAYGGLFDTVGGGFSRYSVDMKWHVPHFEKMLYDNAQLVSVYSDAYKLSQNSHYEEVVRKTLKYVDSEMSNGEGGFYSALDADSLNAQGKLEEGAFYVWTQEQLQKLIGNDFEIFSDVFNIDEFGHWEHGNYVLIQNRPLTEIADANNIRIEDLHSKKRQWEEILFAERKKRSKPRLDDKCLTSWNAMMGKAYADAFNALGDNSYLKTAVGVATFITENCLSPHGNLFHTYKNGKASINGYHEDYAHTIDFLIALYQTTMDENWLTHAKSLTDYCFKHFYTDNGFFAFTSDLDSPLMAKHFETEDNVIPASNSVMAGNLLTLAILFGDQHYEEVAIKMIHSIVPSADYPSAYSNWFLNFMRLSENNRELAICGSDAISSVREIQSLYLPNVILAATDKPSEIPFLRGRYVDRKTLFYVCKNKTCDLPSDQFDDAIKSLKINEFTS